VVVSAVRLCLQTIRLIFCAVVHACVQVSEWVGMGLKGRVGVRVLRVDGLLRVFSICELNRCAVAPLDHPTFFRHLHLS